MWLLCTVQYEYFLVCDSLFLPCNVHTAHSVHSICTVHSITYNEYDSCRSFYCKTVHFLIRQIKKKKCPFQKYCTFICYWLLWLRGSKPTWLVRVWMPCCSCCCWRSSCSWRLRTTASRTPPLAVLWHVTPASTVYITYMSSKLTVNKILWTTEPNVLLYGVCSSKFWIMLSKILKYTSMYTEHSRPQGQSIFTFFYVKGTVSREKFSN